jgi:asparagine synthase (glutamine-hydrolysing)
MAWGLECRVPFLDKNFLDVAMAATPANRKLINQAPYHQKMEKHVIRQAFEDEENPYLPHDILWRQKEQFSDGVGYSWIDGLKAHAEAVVSDSMFEDRADRFPHDTPTTKEAYWYRQIFESLFPEKACLETIVRWIPRRDWGTFMLFLTNVKNRLFRRSLWKSAKGPSGCIRTEIDVSI